MDSEKGEGVRVPWAAANLKGRWHYVLGAFLLACGIGVGVFATWRAAVGRRQYRNVPRTFEAFARRHVERYNAGVDSGPRMTVADFEEYRKKTAGLLFADWLCDTNAARHADNARDLGELSAGAAAGRLREELRDMQGRSARWAGALRVTTRNEVDALKPDVVHVVFEDSLAAAGGVSRRGVSVDVVLRRCPDAAPGNDGVKRFLNCMAYAYQVVDYRVREGVPGGEGH